jgi:hypothetical protein
LVFEAADGYTCASSSSSAELAFLASVEATGIAITTFDLRLFIDELDLKVLNSITVSPQKGMGHFDNVGKALRYAKRFSQIFPDAGTPVVHLKSGEHKLYVEQSFSSSGSSSDLDTSTAYTNEYRDGAWINFPVVLEGEGDTTVLNLFNNLTDNTGNSTDADKVGALIYRGRIIVSCSGLTSTLPDQDFDTLSDGFVVIKNLKMRNSKIEILDPLIDGSSARLNTGVIIDNVVFDNTEDPNFNSNNHGPYVRQIDTTAGANVGNVSVTNCQLLNAHIRFDADAADIKNILIAGNFSRGNDSGSSDNYLIRTEGTGHIFDILDAPSENNIDIRYNLTDSDVANNAGSPPTIDVSGNHPWGDRISRALDVGSKIKTPLIAPISTSTGLILESDSGTSVGRITLASSALNNVSIFSNTGVKVEAPDGVFETDTDTIVLDSFNDIDVLCTEGSININALDSDINLSADQDINLSPASGLVNVNSDLEVDGDYRFGTTQTIQRFYTVDQFYGDLDGSGSVLYAQDAWDINVLGSAAYTQQNITANGDTVQWPAIEFGLVGSAAILRIEIREGWTLKEIQLGVNPISATNWTGDVYSISVFGGNTTSLVSPMTLVDTATDGVGGVIIGSQISTINLSYTGAYTPTTHQPHVLVITQDNPTSYLYWIRTKFEVSTIQAALGVD